jgi:hypothetical protein
MITTAAIRAFFEAQFSEDPVARGAHRRFLSGTLGSDFEEAHWSPSRIGRDGS